MDKKVKIVGKAEAGAIAQAENCLVDAMRFILMADNHQGYGMPVGGVAAYIDMISPSGVGFDIGCGNKALRLNLKFEDISANLSELADEIFDQLSFGVGLNNRERVENERLFSTGAWDLDLFRANRGIKEVARNQLGTIGSGNHYVDVFVDQREYIWIGVHFGSRGLGHKIASHYMKAAGDNLNIMNETPSLLDVNSELGLEYISAMELAGWYAYAGRDWVCQKVASILGGEIAEEVHNHHNFAWEENHDGKFYWVVRKGATPAFPGQRGFIGGSMMDDAYIVSGVESERSKELYYSTVHGAGRVMSRTKAAGKTRRKKCWRCTNNNCLRCHFNTGEVNYTSAPQCEVCGSETSRYTATIQVKQGVVDFAEVKEEMSLRGIELRGAGADEAPQVYKRLPEVLGYHSGTIETVEILNPLIVCMAGKEIYDPYKD